MNAKSIVKRRIVPVNLGKAPETGTKQPAFAPKSANLTGPSSAQSHTKKADVPLGYAARLDMMVKEYEKVSGTKLSDKDDDLPADLKAKLEHNRKLANESHARLDKETAARQKRAESTEKKATAPKKKAAPAKAAPKKAAVIKPEAPAKYVKKDGKCFVRVEPYLRQIKSCPNEKKDGKPKHYLLADKKNYDNRRKNKSLNNYKFKKLKRGANV